MSEHVARAIKETAQEMARDWATFAEMAQRRGVDPPAYPTLDEGAVWSLETRLGREATADDVTELEKQAREIARKED